MNFSKRTFGPGFFMLCAIFTMLDAGAVATAATTDGTSGSITSTESTIKVKVAPKVALHGEKIRIRGASGSKRHKNVNLLFREAGTRGWSSLKMIASDPKGLYRTSVKARESGQFKIRTAPGADSPARALRVRSTLKVKGVNRFVKVGQQLRIRGVVKPAGKRRIKIVINGAGRTIRTQTRPNGGFSAKWRPGSPGNYRVRVFSAGNEVAIGDSSRRFRVSGLRTAHASYYGPGLYGNGVACGGTLSPSTMGVAHKTLPCGTKVTIRYHGRTVKAPVIDRGPYIAGRDYDLTEAVRNRLDFGGVGTVWVDH